MDKKAVIQSAASAASAQGGCASSRLDHGLESREAVLAADLWEFSDCDRPQARLPIGVTAPAVHAGLRFGCQNGRTLCLSGHIESEILTIFWLLARPKIAKKKP